MKAIKSKYHNSNFLPLFLLVIVLILVAGIFLYSRDDRYLKSEQDQYDVLSFCESIPVPVFSVPEGIYDDPFDLGISAPPDYDIYYTTNGALPTTRSHRYQKKILIDPSKNLNKDILYIPTSVIWNAPYSRQNHCTVVRARCFKAGEGYGPVKNIVYSTSDITQHAGFKIVHLFIESDSLFSPQKGIYVMGEKYYSKKTMAKTNMSLVQANWFDHSANYHEKGKKWIRPAEFMLMNSSGKTLYRQSVRLRLHGGSTRAYPIKSFRIMADSIRGNTNIHYRFFDDLPYDIFKTILLRPSGNDQNRTMFRDAMLQQMMKGLGLDIQDYTPAVVYINGNYWGIHDIREKLDENYLAIKYGSATENINILEYVNNKSLELEYGDIKSFQSFKELVLYIQDNSMTDETAYQYVCTQMDIDNFIDYMIVQTFFANSDWITNNIRIYTINEQTQIMQQKNIEAGKWRWLIFDLDYCMPYWDSSINMIDDFLPQFENREIPVMFFGLLKNTEFREKFMKRYEFIIRNCLTASYLMQYIEDFKERYHNEMERHIARWRYPLFFQEWQWRVDLMKTFLRERPEIVLDQLEAL